MAVVQGPPVMATAPPGWHGRGRSRGCAELGVLTLGGGLAPQRGRNRCASAVVGCIRPAPICPALAAGGVEIEGVLSAAGGAILLERGDARTHARARARGQRPWSASKGGTSASANAQRRRRDFPGVLDATAPSTTRHRRRRCGCRGIMSPPRLRRRTRQPGQPVPSGRSALPR